MPEVRSAEVFVIIRELKNQFFYFRNGVVMLTRES
jgi:hypothetical protein